MKLIIPWKVVVAGAVLLLLALVALTLVTVNATRGDEWPMICVESGECYPATPTPPATWQPATVEAVQTAVAGWQASRP